MILELKSVILGGKVDLGARKRFQVCSVGGRMAQVYKAHSAKSSLTKSPCHRHSYRRPTERDTQLLIDQE